MSHTASETKVLAIASHVVHGYVGNTMVVFVLQSLGYEVSAINTVHYSNHTGYKQWKGRKTSTEEMLELYEGLQQSFLNDFSILVSGYIPSAEGVQAVGKIGRDLKSRASIKPGSFFWVLDPVMGDEGQLYIPEDEVPAYRSLLQDADLILPNQFEAELLSGIKIDSLSSIASAIQTLHKTYKIPHIIITSISLPSPTQTPCSNTPPPSNILTIVGSTATSTLTPRLWRIDVPAYPVFFSGTGDMLAALMSFRLREAVFAAGLQNTARWWTPDEVGAMELPLARAAEMALSSMNCVLARTYEVYSVKVEGFGGEGLEAHLHRTKAAEVRVVNNAHVLRDPPDVEKYRAKALEGGLRVNNMLNLKELEEKVMGRDLRDGVVPVLSDGRFASSFS